MVEWDGGDLRGPVGKWFSSEGATVWTDGRPGPLPGTRYLQAFLQVLNVALGVLPPSLYPHSILHLERTLHLVSAISLSNLQGPAHTPPLGSPPSCRLLSSPPLHFLSTPLLSPTHTHTHTDFLNLIFKTLSSSGLRFFTCK